MNLKPFDVENIVSLLTELGPGHTLALHHIKSQPNTTTCGIPVYDEDTATIGWLVACEICFQEYYEAINTSITDELD